jgi:hypothetical protein
MHVLKSHVLPVMAGAAIVVGGLNVASYAVGGHHAAATHGSSVHWAAPDRTPPAAKAAQAKVRHGAYVFKVPHHTAVPFFFQLKAVPKGRYAASFDVATASANGPIVPFCSVADSTSLFAVVSQGQDDGGSTDVVAVNSASGIVRLAHKGEVGLMCQNADETFNVNHSKNTLVLTPLHHVAVVKGSPLPPMRNNQQFGH